MKGVKLLLIVVSVLITACINQVRSKSFALVPEANAVVMGGPYADTLIMLQGVVGQRSITFTSFKEWKGEVWFTQVGAAANVQWRQLERYPKLDSKNRLGWIYRYQAVPRYVGVTRLEIEPDGYKLGLAQITIHVIGPLKTF